MEFVRHPVALITGGSRGIGATTALSLSNDGYNVAITYRNKSARANEVTTEMTRRGVVCVRWRCAAT